MLDAIGSAEILRGVRGAKGVNRAALAEIISKASKLVNDFPEIQEVDLNPIFATEKDAKAVACASSSATRRRRANGLARAKF